MRPVSGGSNRALACAFLIGACIGLAAAPVFAVVDPETDGAPSQLKIRLLSGGGRIWEGPSVSRPTADITFAGYTEKIGPGDLPADYRCRWTIQFQDVQGVDYDRSIFTASQCSNVRVWAAGDTPDAAMRMVLKGDLNGIPGYSVVVLVVDMTEPGGQDQIRIRLFLGDPILGDPNPPNLLYDTWWEFATYPGTSARTYLDSGNLQSKVESTWP